MGFRREIIRQFLPAQVGLTCLVLLYQLELCQVVRKHLTCFINRRTQQPDNGGLEPVEVRRVVF